MTYKDWLERLRREWVGAKVIYEGVRYRVLGIDHNGALLIDRPARFTTTTAVDIYMVTKT